MGLLQRDCNAWAFLQGDCIGLITKGLHGPYYKGTAGALLHRDCIGLITKDCMGLITKGLQGPYYKGTTGALLQRDCMGLITKGLHWPYYKGLHGPYYKGTAGTSVPYHYTFVCLTWSCCSWMQLYVCGLHAVHGPKNVSVQHTRVALAVPWGNVKQCVRLNVPWS